MKTGAFFGIFFYWLGFRKKVVLKNLEIAFSNEKSPSERRVIAYQSYQHFGRVIFESLHLASRSQSNLNSWIHPDNEALIVSLKDNTSPTLFLGYHFGGIEIVGMYLSTRFKPFYAYTGKQSNHQVDQIMENSRTQFGLQAIPASPHSALKMIKVLQKGHKCIMYGDLNVQKTKIFVNFFGLPASMGRGVATIPLKSQSGVYVAWATLKKDLTYRLSIKKLESPLANQRTQQEINLCETYLNQLERIIWDTPEQYFWFNRRWKTRPPGENREAIY